MAILTLLASIICTGLAPTTPTTNVEFEIRPLPRFSTIRYEFAEGSLAGTAYVQSIGYMTPHAYGDWIVYSSGEGENPTKVEIRMENGAMVEGRATHYISGMSRSLVDCSEF